MLSDNVQFSSYLAIGHELTVVDFSYATIPSTFEDIITYLIPELRRRNLFWDDYLVPGGTIRENYFERPGEKRLPQGHPGAKYVWREGEDVPGYVQDEKKGKEEKEVVSVAKVEKKTNGAKRNRDEVLEEGKANGTKRRTRSSQ